MTRNAYRSDASPVVLDVTRPQRPDRTYHPCVGYRRVDGPPLTLHASDQPWDGYVTTVIGSVQIDPDGTCTFHELLVLDEVAWHKAALEDVNRIAHKMPGTFFIYDRTEPDSDGVPSRVLIWTE